jgi:hypothetical protein
MDAPLMLPVIVELYPQPTKDGLIPNVTLPPRKSAVRLPEASVPGAIVPSDPVGLVAPISVNPTVPVVGIVAVGNPAT